jgi:hypothetical protein
MKKLFLFLILFLFVYAAAYNQQSLQTVAEQSNYESTSTYKDVMQFISGLEKGYPSIRVEYIATTAEGRDIPLLVIGDPLPMSPEDLINDNRIVVYIQANIHAGEVEGKEAALMYARDFLSGNSRDILDKVVLLICPILNADGNEKISPMNRRNQNGPVNGVGVRHNGMLLDLNRDAMKVESPEIGGVITNVFKRWDPYIYMDCHTTNGSYHEEPVTFMWMLNPNGDRKLINYMRDKMMPAVGIRLRDEFNVENCYYGNFRDPMDFEKGWYPDASEPRYFTNYFGLRNRLGILNENYVYADFKTRVNGCYFLIRTVVEYAAQYNSEIRDMIRSVDLKTINRGMAPAPADSFAITYHPEPTPQKVTIKAYEVELAETETGRRRMIKTDRMKTVTIPYFADYYPTASVKFPFAYLLEFPDPYILKLLEKHGITVERLTENQTLAVEEFQIEELTPANRLNQGHYTNSVKGKFVKIEKEFPAGTPVVRTSQPLGNLIAYLLEPQSDDGLLYWNYFDRYLSPQWGRGYNSSPVYKILEPVDLETTEE